MSNLDEIGRSRHVSLTTYRKDGTAVATPVWFVMNGPDMIVVSDVDAWKVKRLRNDGRVVVTPCSVRGRIAPGAPSAEGTGRLLDDAGTASARTLLARRYISSRIGNWFVKVLRISKKPVIGIAISF